MKVLYLSSMYHKPHRRDSAAVIHRQAVELARSGMDLRVVCPLPLYGRSGRNPIAPWAARHRQYTAAVDGIKISYIEYHNPPLRLSAGLYVRWLHSALAPFVLNLRREFPFDLIHAHRLFPTGYVAIGIGQQCDVPVVASAVGSDVHTHPYRNGGIRRRTISTVRACHAAVAVSSALAGEIRRLVPTPVQIHVVYRGVDTGHFSPKPSPAELRARLGLPSEGVGICMVGRLTKEKGLVELVEAFAQIAGDYPLTWLTIVGTGPLQAKLQRYAAASGMVSRIVFAGSRPHNEIPDWLNAADIFVLPSYAEGLPNVILEAMACARPVVATRVGGIAEASIHGVCGLLVPPRQVQPLAAALKELIQAPDLRNRMGRAGRERIQQHFSWARTVSALRSIYSDVLSATTVLPSNGSP